MHLVLDFTPMSTLLSQDLDLRTPQAVRLGWPEPHDLTTRQRWVLAGLVLLAHVGAAWWLANVRPAPEVVGEPDPVMVELIAPDQSPPPMPQAAPQPPAPKLTEPLRVPRVVTTRSAQPSAFEAPPEPPPKVVEAAQPLTPVATAAPVAPLAAAPSSIAAAMPQAPAVPRQLAISAVRYLVKPPLVFPPASERLGESGRVLLRVLVDEQGRPAEVTVQQSSGFSRLDQAAVAWIRAARFEPYKEGGVAMPFRVSAPVDYETSD